MGSLQSLYMESLDHTISLYMGSLVSQNQPIYGIIRAAFLWDLNKEHTRSLDKPICGI